jgi:hypothetical protein
MDALDEALPRSNLISALTSRVCRILKTARAQIFSPKSSGLRVPELFNVIGISASLETQNLVLPATITGNLNLQYYRGDNLETCEQRAVFTATEVKYEKLYDGCN